MAELTAFTYQYPQTLLHRLDARFKLLFLVLLSLAGLKASFPGLVLLTATLIFGFFLVKQNLGQLYRNLRIFLLFLIFIFVARSVTEPGQAIFQWRILTVTREGMIAGGLIGWRLMLVVLLSLLLTRTTRPSEVRSATTWLLRPLPFIPAARVGLMLSLMVRFVPLIFERAAVVSDAQRARGVENRKNPLYRLTKQVIPLSLQIFQNADHMALAMEARCYTDRRTDPELTATGRDWWALVAVIGMCIPVVVL